MAEDFRETYEIRRLSDALARDPSSMVFLLLGEKLRRAGQLDVAQKVAIKGLERHPHDADAHDLLARVSADRGELERAFDEWDMVLRLEPGHAGALKGMGFVCFRQGRVEEAERYLSQAGTADPDDQSVVTALQHVREALATSAPRPSSPMPRLTPVPQPPPRRSARVDAPPPAPTPAATAASAPRAEPPAEPRAEPPSAAVATAQSTTQSATPTSSQATLPQHGSFGHGDARALFADVADQDGQTALLLDAQGLVLAGCYMAADGRDLAQEIGAELSGVSDEASRAMRHLGLGSWSSIIVETEIATVAMAPVAGDSLLAVAADRQTPLGYLRRLLDRASERSRLWLERGR